MNTYTSIQCSIGCAEHSPEQTAAITGSTREYLHPVGGKTDLGQLIREMVAECSVFDNMAFLLMFEQTFTPLMK